MRARPLMWMVLSLTYTAGCATTICDPERYPTVETEGAVFYVDVERGWAGATGTCEDPFGEIADAVEAAEDDTTLVVAAGDYGGDIIVENDVSIVGMGTDSVHIGGVESSVAAQGGARLAMQDLTLDGAWYGIWATASTVTLADVDISGSLWFGTYLEQTTATFDRVRLTQHGPGGPGEISGAILANKSVVSLTDCELRENAGFGLAGVGGDFTLRRVVITDTDTDAMGELGVGLEIIVDPESEPPSLYMEDVVVERYTGAAISARGASVDVVGLVVSEALDCDTSGTGHGLVFTDSTTTLSDVSVTSACSAGLSASGSGDLTVTDGIFTDTQPGPDGLGPAVRLDGVVAQLQDSHLGSSVGVGLIASCASVSLDDTSVVSITTTDGGLGGDAVVVGDSDLEIAGGTMGDVLRCGVRVVGENPVDISDVTFDAAMADLCLCDQEADEDWAAAFAAANTVTPDGTPVLDAQEWDVCPEPLPGECS